MSFVSPVAGLTQISHIAFHHKFLFGFGGPFSGNIQGRAPVA